MQKTGYGLLMLGGSQDQKDWCANAKQVPPPKMSNSHNVSVT